MKFEQVKGCWGNLSHKTGEDDVRGDGFTDETSDV